MYLGQLYGKNLFNELCREYKHGGESYIRKLNNDKSITYELLMAGIDKDGMNVELNGKDLEIIGECGEYKYKYKILNMLDYDLDNVNVKLSNGILYVTIPRKKSSLPRKINID